MMHIIKDAARFWSERGPALSKVPLGALRRVCWLIAVVLFGTTLLAGCGAIQMRAGAKPDTQAIRMLEPGKATRQEVLAALGSPQGQGRSMLPWQSSPRTLWSYYYEEGVIDLGGESDDRRVFLFVFFDGDRLDGYMWFSSLRPLR